MEITYNAKGAAGSYGSMSYEKEACTHNCASVLNDTAADLAGFETIPTNLTLSSETVYDKEYRYATANNSLSTTYGQSYTIKSGATVHFQSGASGTITLKKGFKAESGAYFWAFR